MGLAHYSLTPVVPITYFLTFLVVSFENVIASKCGLWPLLLRSLVPRPPREKISRGGLGTNLARGPGNEATCFAAH